VKYLRHLHESEATHLLASLKQIAGFTSGRQKEFFTWKLKNAKLVTIHSTKANKTVDELVTAFLKHYKPKQKQCYTNAWKLATAYPRVFNYVEGELSLSGIPIEHAWNVHLKSGTHIDITTEFVLKGTVEGKEYMQVAEYSADDIYRYADETGDYGGYYRQAFEEHLKK